MTEEQVFELLDKLSETQQFKDALSDYVTKIKPFIKNDIPRGMWFFSRGFLYGITVAERMQEDEKDD